MPIALALLGLAAAGGVLWYAHRPATPTPPPPPNPGANPLPQQRGGPSITSTTPTGPINSTGLSVGGGGAALVEKAGEAIGAVVANSAQTTEGKEIAAPVAGATALALYLANVGGIAASISLVALGGVLIIVFDISVAVVTVVDQIVKGVKTNDWKNLCREIRKFTLAGNYKDAWGLYSKCAKDYDPVEQVWPNPGEDWYGYDDPEGIGRPWSGFPGAPAAQNSVVNAYPSLNLVDQLTTKDQRLFSASAALAAAGQDVATTRAAALASNVAGFVVNPDGVTIGSTTQGDRDMRKEPNYAAALAALNQVQLACVGCQPWLAQNPYQRDIRTPAEAAVDKANLTRRNNALVATQTKQINSLVTNDGLTKTEATAQVTMSQGQKIVVDQGGIAGTAAGTTGQTSSTHTQTDPTKHTGVSGAGVGRTSSKETTGRTYLP